jgi:Rieske 2Fe-2S family protein
VSDVDTLRSELATRDQDPPRMMPALAYTSEEVFAWEQRQVYAGTWTCLGRLDELLPEAAADRKAVLQRAVQVGDVPALLVRDGATVRMFANTCRHRGHELLSKGESSDRQSVLCPYHAWTYRLDGSVLAAPGFREDDGFDPGAHELVELPVETWAGWLFGHAEHELGTSGVPPFDEHLGALPSIVDP